MPDVHEPIAEENPLLALTEKQREVLELLIEHKTSKEISRLLGISPHTVDQRATQARAKLGVSTRGEVASEYRRLKALYEQSAYQFSYIGKNAYRADSQLETKSIAPVSELSVEGIPEGRPAGQVLDYRVGSELFDGRWGTLARLMAILVIALFLVFLVMGGVGLFVTLSHLSGH